jgi:hypothetical protein
MSFPFGPPVVASVMAVFCRAASQASMAAGIVFSSRDMISSMVGRGVIISRAATRGRRCGSAVVSQSRKPGQRPSPIQPRDHVPVRPGRAAGLFSQGDTLVPIANSMSGESCREEEAQSARSDLLTWFYATGSGPISQMRGQPRPIFGLWNGDRITINAPCPPSDRIAPAKIRRRCADKGGAGRQPGEWR